MGDFSGSDPIIDQMLGSTQKSPIIGIDTNDNEDKYNG
jgi:hypothetical protein